jgi:NAD(P)-dependent dehydrogenase (short-subunit alcohol dehydrogenase family)
LHLFCRAAGRHRQAAGGATTPKLPRWSTVAEFGRLDAAFNNAGVMAHIAPIADSTREDWDRVIGINLWGVWSCMKHQANSGLYASGAGRVHPVIVGLSTRNRPLLPRPINDAS